MPGREISDAEAREFSAYQALGPLEDVRSSLKKGEKAKEEAAQSRIDLKAATDERDALKAKVPGEDAVVLTGDEAKAYAAIQTAGKTLKALDTSLTELETAKKELGSLKRDASLRAAAKTEGWNEDAAVRTFGDLRDFEGLAFETAEEEVNFGTETAPDKRKAPVGYVTIDGKKVRLSAYVAEQKDHILPSLIAKAGNGNGGVDVRTVPAPPQRGGGSPPKQADRAAEYVAALNKAADAPNALKPAKT